MNETSKQRNLQEFKYRFWLSLAFAIICFLIAIIVTNTISYNYVAQKANNGASYETIAALKELISMFSLSLSTLLIIGFIGSVLIGVLYLKKYTEEWNKTNEVLEVIAGGNAPTQSFSSETEFNKIYQTADQVGKIYDGLQDLRDNISKGKFNEDLEILSMNNDLAKSGIQMLKNLKKLTENSNQRLWVNESLNEMSELMRSDRKDIDAFSQNILSYIVKKVSANIGALYVVNESESSEAYMEMINCYAYSQKKFLDARIYRGEGLIGRLWQEAMPIVMTDVPDEYCRIITSVGDSKPTCIALIPMLMDQKIVGAIEIAGFKTFEDHELEFVQKAINSFASVYSNIKTEENTRQLLEEAQQLSEETRASEEEIRQNMEELQAIQEELLRKEKETDKLMLDAKERERGLQAEIDRLQLEITNA